MIDIQALARPSVLELKPYSSARSEFDGHADVWLDANENPFNSALNRYPDPLQKDLKSAVSNEAIDILMRVFCNPDNDHIRIATPTYGMYKVSSGVNDIELRSTPLKQNFQLDLETMLFEGVNPKLTFVCSPNNPTGNLLDSNDIKYLAQHTNGLVVIDQAYIDFADTDQKDVPSWLHDYNNIVLLRTLSKAWGMAGARLGMAFASKDVIDLMNRIKPPYNINSLSQVAALKRLARPQDHERQVEKIISERNRLISALPTLASVRWVYPSDANFILVEFENPRDIYSRLLSERIVVRDRTNAVANCLRISVGTREENDRLLNVLNSIP